ncbi:hypothetical protein ACWDUN_21570 [Mycobacterium sp. NPDC003323]
MRWLFLCGVGAVLVGLVGLVTPVSVSPALAVVNCGSAAFPDLSEARNFETRDVVDLPVGDYIPADADYTELCRMDLEDRRLWTLALTGVGVLAGVSSLAVMAMRRRHETSMVGSAAYGH